MKEKARRSRVTEKHLRRLIGKKKFKQHVPVRELEEKMESE